jgi:gentisate 1,2-dioxygenase
MENGSHTEVLRVDSDTERDQAIYEAGFLPGWIGEGGLRPEPLQDFKPHRWRWREGKSLLESAAPYIDPQKSERRNIRMANPADNKRTSLNTIHCSYQMVAPREFVRAHRHTVNAGRFVLESNGAFTTLDDKKVYMADNDIILTPNWVWHGLGNDSDHQAAFWVDFLDDPLVQTLQPMFFEARPEIEDSLPVCNDSPCHIRWSDIQRQLDAEESDSNEFHGRRIMLQTVTMPSMNLYVERIGSGRKTAPKRSTANRLFVCAQGKGETEVDGEIFDWERGDVVAVPSWKIFHHFGKLDATLLEVTDEPMFKTLGWYRETKE